MALWGDLRPTSPISQEIWTVQYKFLRRHYVNIEQSSMSLSPPNWGGLYFYSTQSNKRSTHYISRITFLFNMLLTLNKRQLNLELEYSLLTLMHITGRLKHMPPWWWSNNSLHQNSSHHMQEMFSVRQCFTHIECSQSPFTCVKITHHFMSLASYSSLPTFHTDHAFIIILRERQFCICLNPGHLVIPPRLPFLQTNFFRLELKTLQFNQLF